MGLALAAFFFVISGRMGVVVSLSGVRVRNWIRTIELPWTTVERFEIPDRWPWIAQVVLNQGGSVRVWGVAATGSRHRQSMARQAEIVDALNSAMAQYRP